MAIEKMRVGDKEVVLLGTAHISQQSVEEVRKAIEEEKPDVVGVELDAKRFNQLRQGEKWQNTNIGEIISSGQAYLFLLTIMLTNLQRSLGQQVGVKPGAEMLEAVKAAEENGIPIALLDRDVNITLKRAFHKMSIKEKLLFAGSVFTSFFADDGKELTSKTVEKMKEKDLLNHLIQELAREFPSVKRVLVDERDSYIAHGINSTPGKKVLAVVGAGHVEGIKRSIGKPVDVASITKVEKGFDLMKVVQWAIPIIFGVIILAIFLTKGAEVTLSALALWFFATGLCAASGALIARAHPYAILAALLSAPVTTLHPLLAAGMFSAYAEAKARNPKVKDFEELRNLNSLSDFANNQVTKILLVAALTNIGAMVGTLIAFPAIASLLG